MRKVLYTKFSRERRNEFQIMPRITEEDGIRRVWKLPLQKEGELHIRHMYENYRKLEHLYTYAGVQICPCELDEEKCALAFPFVEGESLETRISRHGKEKDFASLKKDYELLYQIIASAKGQKSFVETDAFCEVFGHPALKEGLAAAEISNIDMIPGNLLLDGEKVWVADYEWVFPFTDCIYLCAERLFTGGGECTDEGRAGRTVRHWRYFHGRDSGILPYGRVLPGIRGRKG